MYCIVEFAIESAWGTSISYFIHFAQTQTHAIAFVLRCLLAYLCSIVACLLCVHCIHTSELRTLREMTRVSFYRVALLYSCELMSLPPL